jgi:hypothetical protein
VARRYAEPAQGALGDASDGNQLLGLPLLEQLLEEGQADRELGGIRRAVRGRAAIAVGVKGEGSPEQWQELVLGEGAPKRGRGLLEGGMIGIGRWQVAVVEHRERGHPLTEETGIGERDAGDAGAAVAGGLAEEKDGGTSGSELLEVAGEVMAALGATGLGGRVEVGEAGPAGDVGKVGEKCADPGRTRADADGGS